MNIDTIKAQPEVVSDTSQPVPEHTIGKKSVKVLEQFIFSILQYVFLPVLCGFLTAGILATRVIEKLGLDSFAFANFATIKIETATSSNYPGLMLTAGLGCVLGLILSRILRFGARLGHFDFISPPRSLDTMAVPSAVGFIKSIIRLAGIPVIVVLGAMASLELAKTGMLPAVHVDTKYMLFEVTLAGQVIVAALGCLLMYLFDMVLTVLLRMGTKKNREPISSES